MYWLYVQKFGLHRAKKWLALDESIHHYNTIILANFGFKAIWGLGVKAL